MTNREAKARRLRRAAAKAKAAQPIRLNRVPPVIGSTAEGAARHARHVAQSGGRAVCTVPETQWFGDAKRYQRDDALVAIGQAAYFARCDRITAGHHEFGGKAPTAPRMEDV